METIKSLYKISGVQLDVNGLCNAGCWFCPISYAGNPLSARRDMTLDELESVFKQLSDGKGDFVNPDLNLIYSAHYNEVLLYKDLRGMFDLYRKYGFKTNILSNGVALTNSRVDLMFEYKDILNGILLNIPTSDPDKWEKYVKMNKKLFPKVISNVQYLIKKFGTNPEGMFVHLMINGVNSESLTKNGGWLDLLENAPDIDLDNDLSNELIKFSTIFPGLDMRTYNHIYDRSGQLEKYGIMTQANAIEKNLKPMGSKVIGCNGGIEVRSRTNEWIHINANGDTFICCNDFDFDTIFGNVFNSSLREIWYSSSRQDAIADSYSKMCTKCSAAIWG